LLLVGAIAEGYPFIGQIVGRWTRKWTLQESYAALAVVSFIGFIFGALVSVRHPHVVQTWFSSAFVLGILMMFFLWLLNSFASHVEIPQNMKLADCTVVTMIHLQVPKGQYFNLVLVAPPRSTNAFAGQVHVSEGGSIVTNFSIGSNQTEQQCSFFHAESNYEIQIVFDSLPPPSTSVWLHWLQAYKDRDK